jgi:hypothetical protein
LDTDKQHLGRNFDAMFETEVRVILKDSGYENFFWDDNDSKILQLQTESRSKDSNSVTEFCAFVIGNSRNFLHFREQFLISFSEFLPRTPTDNNRHLLLVEAKLNSKLLFEWISNAESAGSRRIFFSEDIGSIFVKVVVVNGGRDSEEFVKSMHLKNPPPEFVKYIEALKRAQINVFYKLWASGETFQDLFTENKAIKAENQEIKAKNLEIEALLKKLQDR